MAKYLPFPSRQLPDGTWVSIFSGGGGHEQATAHVATIGRDEPAFKSRACFRSKQAAREMAEAIVELASWTETRRGKK